MQPQDLIYDLITTGQTTFRQIEDEKLMKINQIIDSHTMESSLTSNNKSIILEFIPRGHSDIATKLYQSIPGKYFFDAVVFSDFEEINRRIDENPDIVNQKSSLEGLTPLHLAAGFSNNLQTVELLIAKGAKIDVYSEGGLIDALTPIISATLGRNTEIVKYLLELGADPNSQEIETKTSPLHIATFHQKLDICKALLEYGADPTLLTHDGRSPLDNVRKNKNEELMALFRL